MMESAVSTGVENSGGANPSCLYLGIKVRPGPVERHRLDDFPLNNTVIALKQQAENRAKLPADSLDVIHHGRILKDDATLADSGVRGGEMLHVVKRKVTPAPEPPPVFTDAELQQIVLSLRAFGCTPNASGWIRAMQVLDDETRMEEIMTAVPGLAEDCASVSMLHEIELLAVLGSTLQTMRRGAAALPLLFAALRQLTRIVRANPPDTPTDPARTSGFAYSLEALSEDEDGDEEEEEGGSGMLAITQEQLAAALRVAQENISTPGGNMSLLQLLQGSGTGSGGDSSGATSAPDSTRTPATPVPTAGSSRNFITSDMFSNAVAEALNRADFNSTPAGTPMDQSTTASSSQSPGPGPNPEDYSGQLQHMHEVGLVDDAVNLRALLICSGDVNAAINFVFTSMEE